MNTRVDVTQRRNGTVVLVGIALLLVALAGRIVHINWTLHEKLTGIADRQQSGSTIIPHRRGLIFDARGRMVAGSRLVPDVFVDPLLVGDVDALAQDLGARLNLEPGKLADGIRARAGRRFHVVAQGVDEVTAQAVRELRNPAVGLTMRAARTYPFGTSMAHVLGFVGRDGVGLEGIESWHNEHLSGRDGRRRTIRDAARRALRGVEGGAVRPVDGGHIVLTIDAEIQAAAERAVENAVAQFEAESGVAVVMSPKTGEVLAMVSWPTYDPNRFGESTPQQRRNRVVTDPTEPGSTFKPFLASGALADGVLSTTELIDCGMGRRYFGRRLVKDVSPHGLMDIKGIITKSSNIGMGIIAERMGDAALYDIMRRFGFGERLGIECPGEASGIVYPLRLWTSMSAASIAMGYEVAVTPIQLAAAFSAIVNDGVYVAPRLVKRLLASDGTVLEQRNSRPPPRRVIPSNIAQYMATELLVSVVVNGSGWRAALDDYQVMGKTGTAKLTFRDRGGYEPGAYLSLFMGAAPVRDPQVVAIVMIRRPNPSIGYYGGQVSGPAVREILRETLAYLGVPPDGTVAMTAAYRSRPGL